MLIGNAITFVTAADYLRESFDSTQTEEHTSVNGCKWQFIPSRASWFGAIWERMISIVKLCLKKVLGRVLLTFDESPSISAEVGLWSIINL